MNTESDLRMFPVGWVRSAHRERSSLPHQGRGRELYADIELRPEMEPAAREIKPGDQIWVLCWFHLGDRETLRVHPRGDPANPETGVFSTRSPSRPNPIGLSLVEVTARNGLTLSVKGLEMVDGTPVLDIKPHLSRLDG